MKEAAQLGDAMLKEAGPIGEAAARIREQRHERLGNALEGILDLKVSKWLEEPHRQYLVSMATDGVPARLLFQRHRIEAKPHGSAVEHVAEMYAKAWKDSKHLAILWCTEASREHFDKLVDSAVEHVA